MELHLIGGLGLVFITTLVLLLKRNNRPKAKLEDWGVHFTPNSVYTASDLNKAVSAFMDTWTTAYPHHVKALRQALKNLDIIWHPKRIKYKEEFVMALMESPNKIHLWIGPRLKDGSRHLAYTGLLDQLGKLALLLHNEEPDTSRAEIRKILADVRAKIF